MRANPVSFCGQMLDARPEHQILICVARLSPDPDTQGQLRQLFETDLDWKYLLATAQRHCVVPLLHRHLTATKTPTVPPQAMKELEDANHENTNSNLFLTGELIKLLDFLQANQIEAIPFKGPTLALAAYGEIGLRQFGDLDILVHKTEVVRIKQLLIDRGFKPQLEISHGREAALWRFDRACNFVNPKGVMVDVHWEVVERHLAFDIDTNRLWERLEPVTIVGKQFLTLSNEDLLLVLCLHGFTHFWERLGWICDIAGLLERKQVNWQLLLQNAAALGARRIVSLGLLLASDLLKAPLPPDVLKAVNGDPVATGTARKVRQQLFIKLDAPAGILDEARLVLTLRERKRDKLRSCFALIATPRSYDWMFLSLPDSLSFLYYLIRPLRLAGKYGAKLLKGSDGHRAPTTKAGLQN